MPTEPRIAALPPTIFDIRVEARHLRLTGLLDRNRQGDHVRERLAQLAWVHAQWLAFFLERGKSVSSYVAGYANLGLARLDTTCAEAARFEIAQEADGCLPLDEYGDRVRLAQELAWAFDALLRDGFGDPSHAVWFDLLERCETAFGDAQGLLFTDVPETDLPLTPGAVNAISTALGLVVGLALVVASGVAEFRGMPLWWVGLVAAPALGCAARYALRRGFFTSSPTSS